MTENSYSDLTTNDKSSDDSYTINDGNKSGSRRSDGSKKENVEDTTSKTDSRSSSTQNDDKSEHYIRLLKESQQSVSNRDLLIGMLQRQLKKMEDLYKKTLDQQQELRLNFSNAVQELGHLKIVSNKLTDENHNLLKQNEENTARYRAERENLQVEVEKWKKEYDHLMTAIESMEKNTCTMKKILKDGSNDPRKQNLPNSPSMEKLLDHYVKIQEALTQQNEKLDTFLQKFEVIGDGGCTIIKSLEGMKCVNKQLTKSLDSVVAERAEQPFEQAPAMMMMRADPVEEPEVKTEVLDEEQQTPVGKPEKQKKNKKQKAQKNKNSDDEPCGTACYDEYDIVWKPTPPPQGEKSQTKPKQKSKSKSHSTRQAPPETTETPQQATATPRETTETSQQMPSYYYNSEEIEIADTPLEAPAPVMAYRSTMEGSCCGSVCSCNDLGAELNTNKNDKAVNTDCDCCDEYEIPEDDEDLRERLIEAMNEIDRLNKLLEEQPEGVGGIMQCQQILDPHPDYEDVVEERDALKAENNGLKEVILNLESEVKRLNDEADTAYKHSGEGPMQSAATQMCREEPQVHSKCKKCQVNMDNANMDKLANALEELKALREERNTLLEKISLLNESVKQHKDQTCLCKIELQKVNTKAAALEDALKEVQDVAQKRCSGQSQNLAAAMAELDRVSEAYDQLKRDYDSLVEDKKDVELLKKTNANLVRELDERDILIQELREQVAGLEKEVADIREEMVTNNHVASQEMDVLMNCCLELENKLGMTKEILEKEVKLIDEEVNTSYVYTEKTTSCNIEVNALRDHLNEKNEEIAKLVQELEEARTIYQEELQALKDYNDLLHTQLEQEQEQHQRDMEAVEAEQQKAETHSSSQNNMMQTGGMCYDLDPADDNEDLKAQLDATQGENRTLKDELDEANRELTELKGTGKEFGVLKAENMQLKSKISLLQKQMVDMKDVEEKMSKLRIDKEEMKVKVQYLENQLNAARSKNSLDKICSNKKCGLTLATIDEEEATPTSMTKATKLPVPKDASNKNACNANTNTSTNKCVCDDRKYQLNTHVTILYDNKKFNKASNTDSVLTVDSQQSTDLPSYSGGVAAAGNKLNKLQMRIASINQMEQQVANMIVSVRQQNQRLNECNTARMRNEKDIESRLHHLKHKRQQLMTSLNTFQKEIEVLGIETRSKAKTTSDNGRCHPHCH